ncbi:MAG: hypothetical protein U0T79_09410 [Ferruginibacter sp.]
MNNPELNLLKSAIVNYKSRQYSESEFHSAIESAMRLITEIHLQDIREAMEAIEAKLEQIDFTSNTKRQDYLDQIPKIEKLITVLQMREALD